METQHQICSKHGTYLGEGCPACGQSNSRVRAYLGELQAQLDNAREHLRLMTEAQLQSCDWERPEDRDWIAGAREEARRTVVAAQGRLELGRAIAGEMVS